MLKDSSPARARTAHIAQRRNRWYRYRAWRRIDAEDGDGAADKVDEKGRGFMAKAFDQRQMQALAAKKAAFRAASLHNVRASKGMGPNKACGHKGGICRQGSKRG